jgi:hypothetical protein
MWVSQIFFFLKKKKKRMNKKDVVEGHQTIENDKFNNLINSLTLFSNTQHKELISSFFSLKRLKTHPNTAAAGLGGLTRKISRS